MLRVPPGVRLTGGLSPQGGNETMLAQGQAEWRLCVMQPSAIKAAAVGNMSLTPVTLLSNKLSHAVSFTMSFHSAEAHAQHTALPGCICTVTHPSLRSSSRPAVILPMCSCHFQTLGCCVAHHGHVGQAPNCFAIGNAVFAAMPPESGSWMIDQRNSQLHQYTCTPSCSNAKNRTEVSKR